MLGLNTPRSVTAVANLRLEVFKHQRLPVGWAAVAMGLSRAVDQED